MVGKARVFCLARLRAEDAGEDTEAMTVISFFQWLG
jgi:hypothetical protein